MNEKVIDLEEVMERVQDDKELLLELFEIFTNDYFAKTKLMRAAILEKNLEVIKDLVHSIKGAAGNISAKVVHAKCIEIEKLCSSQDFLAIGAAGVSLDGHFKDLQVRMAEIKKVFSD